MCRAGAHDLDGETVGNQSPVVRHVDPRADLPHVTHRVGGEQHIARSVDDPSDLSVAANLALCVACSQVPVDEHDLQNHNGAIDDCRRARAPALNTRSGTSARSPNEAVAPPGTRAADLRMPPAPMGQLQAVRDDGRMRASDPESRIPDWLVTVAPTDSPVFRPTQVREAAG